jgi:hypothetical protein
MMNLSALRVGAFAAVVTATQLVGLGVPAHAASCVQQDAYTSTTPSYSSPFNASLDCEGVWAIHTTVASDWVTGQYYKDGGWHTSTLQAQLVTMSDSSDKVVGNTVDGRRCRGFNRNYTQYVRYKY